MQDFPASQDPRSEGRRRARIYQAFFVIQQMELITPEEWRKVTKAYTLLEALRDTPETSVPSSPIPLDPIPEHVLPSVAELVDSMDRVLLPWSQGLLSAWEVRRRIVYWAEEIVEIFSNTTRLEWEKVVEKVGIPRE